MGEILIGGDEAGKSVHVALGGLQSIIAAYQIRKTEQKSDQVSIVRGVRT